MLNRDVHLETERHRQGTMTERQRVDDTNLTAQNLFYRKAQISKEIGQCRRYVYVLSCASGVRTVPSASPPRLR